MIWGENGSGKTSILEAVHILSMGKSFRTHMQKNLIKNGEEGYVVQGFFNTQELKSTVATELKKKGIQKTKINGKKLLNRKELIGRNNVVVLSPEEQNITKGGPSERRKFFDRLFSMVSGNYIDALQSYNRALKQRNSALLTSKGRTSSKEGFLYWNEPLAIYGEKVWKIRKELIKEFQKDLAVIIKKYGGNITIDLDHICLGFEKKIFIEHLLKTKHKDIKYKTTRTGPHRDNISIKFSGKNIRLFGSQGEHKISLVLLKLAEVVFIKNKTGKYPMLLLDDVFAKLDLERSRNLVRLINDLELESGEQLQTIVTTTDIIDIQKSGMFDTKKETVTHKLERKCNT